MSFIHGVTAVPTVVLISPFRVTKTIKTSQLANDFAYRLCQMCKFMGWNVERYQHSVYENKVYELCINSWVELNQTSKEIFEKLKEEAITKTITALTETQQQSYHRHKIWVIDCCDVPTVPTEQMFDTQLRLRRISGLNDRASMSLLDWIRTHPNSYVSVSDAIHEVNIPRTREINNRLNIDFRRDSIANERITSLCNLVVQWMRVYDIPTRHQTRSFSHGSLTISTTSFIQTTKTTTTITNPMLVLAHSKKPSQTERKSHRRTFESRSPDWSWLGKNVPSKATVVEEQKTMVPHTNNKHLDASQWSFRDILDSWTRIFAPGTVPITVNRTTSTRTPLFYPNADPLVTTATTAVSDQIDYFKATSELDGVSTIKVPFIAQLIHPFPVSYPFKGDQHLLSIQPSWLASASRHTAELFPVHKDASLIGPKTGIFVIQKECPPDTRLYVRLFHRCLDNRELHAVNQETAHAFIDLKALKQSTNIKSAGKEVFVTYNLPLVCVGPNPPSEPIRLVLYLLEQEPHNQNNITGLSRLSVLTDPSFASQQVVVARTSSVSWVATDDEERQNAFVTPLSKDLTEGHVYKLEMSRIISDKLPLYSPYATFSNGQSIPWKMIDDEPATILGRMPLLMYYYIHNQARLPLHVDEMIAHFVRLVCMQEGLTLSDYISECKTDKDHFVGWFLSKVILLIPILSSYTSDPFTDNHSFLSDTPFGKAAIDCEEISTTCAWIILCIRSTSPNSGAPSDCEELNRPLRERLSYYTTAHLSLLSRSISSISSSKAINDPTVGEPVYHIACCLLPNHLLHDYEYKHSELPILSTLKVDLQKQAKLNEKYPVIILDAGGDSESIYNGKRLKRVDANEPLVKMPSWLGRTWSAKQQQVGWGFKSSVVAIYCIDGDDTKVRQIVPITYHRRRSAIVTTSVVTSADSKEERWNLGMKMDRFWSGRWSGNESDTEITTTDTPSVLWTPHMPPTALRQSMVRVANELRRLNVVSFQPQLASRCVTNQLLQQLVQEDRAHHRFQRSQTIKRVFVLYRKNDHQNLTSLEQRVKQELSRMKQASSPLYPPDSSKNPYQNLSFRIISNENIYVIDSLHDVSLVQLFFSS